MQSNSKDSIVLGVIAALIVTLIAGGIVFVVSSFDHGISKEIQKTNSIVQAHIGLKCPRCGGGMDRGFVIDYARGPKINAWTPGEPQLDWLGDLKGNDSELIATFRCSKCGYLESYTK